MPNSRQHATSHAHMHAQTRIRERRLSRNVTMPGNG